MNGFLSRLKEGLGFTPEEQARFERAMEHPYECGCEDCRWYATKIPPERDDDND